MLILWRRELAYYLWAKSGYVILAAALFVDGLLFNAFAVGPGMRRSTEVLESFFYLTSGITMAASILLAMRLVAEERQNKTLVLLACSPLTETQVVYGKFLAALTFVALLLAATGYMPALIFVHGQVALGHVAAGYLGLLLLASSCLAIGTLCSALSPTQLVAAIASCSLVAAQLALWLLARIASPPMGELLGYLSLYDRHFRPFMQGIVHTGDVVFYLSLTYVALTAATCAMEARRWR